MLSQHSNPALRFSDHLIAQPETPSQVIEGHASQETCDSQVLLKIRQNISLLAEISTMAPKSYPSYF